MSFEAESNSELTVIVPAYQLHFRCKTKYTNKTFCQTPGPAYLAVLPVLVIFCPLGPTNFKKSAVILYVIIENDITKSCMIAREQQKQIGGIRKHNTTPEIVTLFYSTIVTTFN